MKIRLIATLPIELKHGAVEGREFEVTRAQDGKAWFRGDAGEECAALGREYQVIG